MKRLKVTMSAELKERIKAQVASGGHANLSEYVPELIQVFLREVPA